MKRSFWVVFVSLLFAFLNHSSAYSKPLTPGNIIISDPFHLGQSLLEYQPDGTLVQSIEIEQPGNPGSAGGITFDDQGLLWIYNGDSEPYLSSWDFQTNTWTHLSCPGWSSYLCFPCQGIGTFANFVFVTDMGAFGNPNGLVRFDLSDMSCYRFAEGINYSDLSVGLDGLLYARRYDNSSPPPPTMIDVFDPITLEPVKSLTLSERSLTITADMQGHIYGVRGSSILNYNPDGTLIDTHQVTEESALYTISLSQDGRIVVVGSNISNGEVVIVGPDFIPQERFSFHTDLAYAAIIPQPSTEDLNVFGMAVGNYWRYEGTHLGQPYVVERNIPEINSDSFPVPVFKHEIHESSVFSGTEYYEVDGYDLKLWGISFIDEDGINNVSFSEGLTVAWTPMSVGEHKSSTADVTIDTLPGYIFDAEVAVDVISLEDVTLDFGVYEAFKINYTLDIWGYGASSSDSFTWWIVPYLGVVKDEDTETSIELKSFSIGDGDISETSDADNDGLIDFLELTVCKTHWQNPDTDGDGLLDGIEDANHNGIIDPGETDPLNLDTDADGLPDGIEDANQNGIVDAGETDPLDPDSDDDGFTDQEEVICSSDPRDAASRCSVGLPWLILLLGD